MIFLFFLLSFTLQAQLRSLVLDSAALSAAVYHDSPQSRFKIIATHENMIFGNRLIVFRDPQAQIIYIVVRGSAKIGNWISNLHVGASNSLIEYALLKFVPKAGKLTKAWFLEVFDDLDQATNKALSKFPKDRVIFTGHSYGGLMANLLAQKTLERDCERVVECHTFNAPGGMEIRLKTLQLPVLSEEILYSRFFNHRRWSDVVGHLNTHEGKVLFYGASRLKDPVEEHQISQFSDDLLNGLEPL